MSKEEVYFGLYYDESCQQMIGKRLVDGEFFWVLDFGRVDAGEQKDGIFYIKNLSGKLIEDLEVQVRSLDVEGVAAEVIGGRLTPSFEPGDVLMVNVRWSARSNVKAARCQGELLIEGLLVNEEHRIV